MMQNRGRIAAGAVALVMLAALPACSTAGPSSGPSDTVSSAGSAPSRSVATSAGATGSTSAGQQTSSRSTDRTSTPRDSASATGSADPLTCRALAGRLSLDQRIGQLFMAGTSSTGMSSSEASRLATLKVGSVLLLGNTTAGRAAVLRVTQHIRRGVGTDHGVKVMLAADQEGGLVQRLSGPGFATIPSAEQQSRLSTGELQRRAGEWGRQLKAAGIDVDLAPVADVVPASIGTANQPIGALHRGYGPHPQHVAADVVAFIRGMHTARVGATVKHFPGLGVVTGNTDLIAHVVDSRTTRHGTRLAGFKAGAQAGVDMEMVSSAVYTKIDAHHPATYSPTVIQGMLRGDLAFKGVIISDDLMGKALGSVPLHERALRFIETGGDLAIVGDPGSVAPMVRAVRSAATHDQRLRTQILASTTRVLTLKSRYGLADCG